MAKGNLRGEQAADRIDYESAVTGGKEARREETKGSGSAREGRARTGTWQEEGKSMRRGD